MQRLELPTLIILEKRETVALEFEASFTREDDCVIHVVRAEQGVVSIVRAMFLAAIIGEKHEWPAEKLGAGLTAIVTANPVLADSPQFKQLQNYARRKGLL